MIEDRYMKTILKKAFRAYLIYVFIFSILIFTIYKPKERQYFRRIKDNLGNDRVTLIEERMEAGLTRLNLIKNAEKTLDISYYTLLEGKSTEIFLASLIDAADRGVEVRIILDGLFHNLKGGQKDAIYAFENHPNIQLKLYESFNFLSPWAWNNRLHDKIIIVDKKLALIGGRNIGDKYFLEESNDIELVNDRDVLIFNEDCNNYSNSVIYDMEKYYNEIWNYKYSKAPLDKLSRKQRIKGIKYGDKLKSKFAKFEQENVGTLSKIDWQEKTIATTKIDFVHNPIGRLKKDPWTLKELLRLASNTKESIFVQSPYIIPSRSIKAKLNNYNIDLEKVNILTNSFATSPNLIAISGYANHRNDMINAGVNIYEFHGLDSLHAKTYVFDHDISAIGSFNLDPRSTYINSESMVIIYGEEFAEGLKDKIDLHLEKSLQVNRDYSYKENNFLVERSLTLFKEIGINILSKCVYFLEPLI